MLSIVISSLPDLKYCCQKEILLDIKAVQLHVRINIIQIVMKTSVIESTFIHVFFFMGRLSVCDLGNLICSTRMITKRI